MEEAITLFNGVIAVGAKIDNLWSMYIGVQLAVFWLILTVDRPLMYIERITAFVAHTGFSYINGMSLIGSYKFLETLKDELINDKSAFLSKYNKLQALAETWTFVDREQLIMLTHGGAWIIIGIILVFQNKMFVGAARTAAKKHPFPKKP